jgi:hypothetical protein
MNEHIKYPFKFLEPVFKSVTQKQIAQAALIVSLASGYLTAHGIREMNEAYSPEVEKATQMYKAVNSHQPREKKLLAKQHLDTLLQEPEIRKQYDRHSSGSQKATYGIMGIILGGSLAYVLSRKS